jgi:hypothetical protein
MEKTTTDKSGLESIFYNKKVTMTAELASAYTALIPEYAYILSHPEYHRNFMQGRFGIWEDPENIENPDGSDRLKTPLFNQDQLTLMYYKTLGIYDVNLINNGKPEDPDAQDEKPGVLTHKFGITFSGASGGIENSAFNSARISLSNTHFHYEDDGIFETLGHEVGHVKCFLLKSLKLQNHESNMPHVDFYKGLGLIFSQTYQSLKDKNMLPFSIPGDTPNIMMGIESPWDKSLGSTRQFCCQVIYPEMLEESESDESFKEAAQAARTCNTRLLTQKMTFQPNEQQGETDISHPQVTSSHASACLCSTGTGLI